MDPTNEQAERAELRRLLAEATPGPWVARRWSVRSAEHYDVAECSDEPDAALVAAAVNALPRVLDALDAAERERDEARAEAAGLRSTVAFWHDIVRNFWRCVGVLNMPKSEPWKVNETASRLTALHDERDALAHDLANARTAVKLGQEHVATLEALLRKARTALDLAARELFLLGASGESCDEPDCTDHAAAAARSACDAIDAALPAKEVDHA